MLTSMCNLVNTRVALHSKVLEIPNLPPLHNLGVELVLEDFFHVSISSCWKTKQNRKQHFKRIPKYKSSGKEGGRGQVRTQN